MKPTSFFEKGRPGLTGERKRFWESTARFQVVPAGRRSGKSVLASWKLASKLFQPKSWSDPRYFYAGPTQSQVKRIAWDRFKALIPRPLIHSINETQLRIRTVMGSELWLIGLDSPQRVEGVAWDGGIIDERADIKRGAWDANIRPSLSDRSGFCWHIGVPDFQGRSGDEYKALFDLARSGNDPEWDAFTWPSSEVLLEEEIESARRRLPPILFRQEYEASFESAPGRAYYEFTYAVHVSREPLVFDATKPLVVSCDFNFAHHNWGVYQFVDGVYKILGDHYLPNATVGSMIAKLQDQLQVWQPKNLVFYGDYSGEQRRAEATRSAWREIKDAFPHAEFKYKKQPPIADRLNAVNTALRNAKGEVHVVVDPNARNHIRDLEQVSRTMLYGSDKGGELTHASDAFGYFVYEHAKNSRYDALDLTQLDYLL